MGASRRHDVSVASFFDLHMLTAHRRVRQAALCADQYRNRHVLATVAASDVVWGGHDQSYLTYRGGKVLTVVFVARMMRVIYMDGLRGEPHRCQQIKYRHFREADDISARALTYGKSYPAEGMYMT